MILRSINETSLNTATGLQYSIITTYQLWLPLAPQTDHYDHLAKRQQICYRLELLCIKEAINKGFWGRCGIMLRAFNSEFPLSHKKDDIQLPGNLGENRNLRLHIHVKSNA